MKENGNTRNKGKQSWPSFPLVWTVVWTLLFVSAKFFPRCIGPVPPLSGQSLRKMLVCLRQVQATCDGAHPSFHPRVVGQLHRFCPLETRKRLQNNQNCEIPSRPNAKKCPPKTQN